MDSHCVLLLRKANEHTLWNNKNLLLHLEYSQESSTNTSFLERCQGTCEEKLQNVCFRHIQQHCAKILWWVTMYQAANDSKEECCLPTFQSKLKYVEIPLILPDSPKLWNQSPKEQLQTTVRLFLFLQLPILDVLMHAYINIYFIQKQIYLHIRPQWQCKCCLFVSRP